MGRFSPFEDMRSSDFDFDFDFDFEKENGDRLGRSAQRIPSAPTRFSADRYPTRIPVAIERSTHQ